MGLRGWHGGSLPGLECEENCGDFTKDGHGKVLSSLAALHHLEAGRLHEEMLVVWEEHIFVAGGSFARTASTVQTTP